jgi:hypothetical protein
LSFAQQRLWFLNQLEPENPAYNIVTLDRLTGPLDCAALEQSFNRIAERHEVLRTTFESGQGQPRQRIVPALTLTLPVVDLTHFAGFRAGRGSAAPGAGRHGTPL